MSLHRRRRRHGSRRRHSRLKKRHCTSKVRGVQEPLAENCGIWCPMYSKKYDKTSKTFFYVNKKTGESHWEKPAALGAHDINVSARTAAQAGIPFIEHHTARFKAKDLTPEEAAIHIQGIWRAHRPPQYATTDPEVYRKKYDPASKKYFYLTRRRMCRTGKTRVFGSR